MPRFDAENGYVDGVFPSGFVLVLNSSAGHADSASATARGEHREGEGEGGRSRNVGCTENGPCRLGFVALDEPKGTKRKALVD